MILDPSDRRQILSGFYVKTADFRSSFQFNAIDPQEFDVSLNKRVFHSSNPQSFIKHNIKLVLKLSQTMV